MKEIKLYETYDGQKFNSLKDAEYHELKLDIVELIQHAGADHEVIACVIIDNYNLKRKDEYYG